MPNWNLISHHGLVLAHISRHPRSTAREVATAIGMTERSILKIIRDLEEVGYLNRKKTGRQNYYQINAKLRLNQPGHGEVEVGDLLRVLGWKGPGVAKEQIRLL